MGKWWGGGWGVVSVRRVKILVVIHGTQQGGEVYLSPGTTEELSCFLSDMDRVCMELTGPKGAAFV